MRRSKEVALDVLLHFEEELNALALAEFLQFLRRLYRLETISYVCPSLSLWLIQDPCLALAYSDAWLDHRAAKAHPAEEAQDAVDWTFLPRIEAEMGRVRAEANVAFGRRGFIVRLSGPGNALTGLLWVTADDDDASWEQRRAELNREFVDIGHYVHRCAQRMHAGKAEDATDPMTRREIEALGWFADGLKVDDIGAAMRIAPAIVRAHLDSRCKLGALTLAHAAAKALRGQLI